MIGWEVLQLFDDVREKRGDVDLELVQLGSAKDGRGVITHAVASLFFQKGRR